MRSYPHLFYYEKKIVIILFLLLVCCSDNQSYSVRGVLLEIRKEQNVFIIHHDEIPGFMMAMTMPFKLADSLDINRFGVGDSLKFHLNMKEDKAFANNFQLLGKGTLLETDNSWDDEYAPLDIGDIFANSNFLDVSTLPASFPKIDFCGPQSTLDESFRHLLNYHVHKCEYGT